MRVFVAVDNVAEVVMLLVWWRRLRRRCLAFWVVLWYLKINVMRKQVHERPWRLQQHTVACAAKGRCSHEQEALTGFNTALDLRDVAS